MKRILVAFALGLVLTASAWADSTIDLMGAGAALTGTEKLPMFQTANPAVTTTPNALKTFVTGSGVVTSITNSDGTLTISPTTGASVASLALGHANTWSAVQSFTNGDLSLLGATSGNTLLEATAAAGAGTIATFPANTGIVAELNLAQTFSAVQTFSASNGIVYSGAATGTQVACLGLDASNNVIKSAAACGSGGGGTPGGATTNVQFNNAGAFGGDAGFTYTTLGQVTIAGGTITTNNKALNITQTWNNAATTFDAPIFENITNTASNVASLLMDLQVGSTSQFQVVASGPAAYVPSSGIMGASSGVLKLSAANLYFMHPNTNIYATYNNGLFNTSSVGLYSWSTTSPQNFASEIGLGRDGTDSLAIYDTGTLTNPTTQHIYKTVDNGTSPTNFERGIADWLVSSGIYTIGTQAGGTGTARQMIIRPAALFSAAGVPLPACNTTAGGGFPNGTKGAIAVVSDATAPTYNANYSSGGAVVAIVVCNGSNWVTQ